MIDRNNLHVINGTSKCQGIITRKKETINGIEDAVLDYVIVSETLIPFILKMKIDDEQNNVLTNYNSKKGKKKVVKSDHNVITCTLNLKVEKNKKERKEILNLRNKDELMMFRENTENANKFIDCFKTNDDIKAQGKKWHSILKRKISESFKKVRIKQNNKSNKNTILDRKLKERKEIKMKLEKEADNKIKYDLEDSLELIAEEISYICFDEFVEKIKDHLKDLSSQEGNFDRNKMWKLRKKICPKNTKENITAKEDENGKLETNPSKLKNLYLETFQHRLRHRKIKPELENLQKLRKQVFKIRLKKSKLEKSPDWTEKDLDKVLNKLKNEKAKDPSELVNEIFKNMGKDLKKSMLILQNKVKNELESPEFMEWGNIVSIYKGKGQRKLLENKRGIFILNILRMIRDKMIYNRNYEKIDQNMSESNVGGRKNRSYREHLLILYSIINSVNQKECPPIDCQLYDVKQCFNSLDLIECCNDLYESGMTNDDLAQIYEGNKNNKIAVNTPCGQTDRISMPSIVAQGGSWGVMKCSVQIDKIGKKALETQNENLLKYKNEIPIPMLSMVDDVLNIAVCGIKSVETNAFVNAHFEMKNLELNSKKCHNIHIGKNPNSCVTLKAHNEIILNTDKEKYVGDTISKENFGDTISQRKFKN